MNHPLKAKKWMQVMHEHIDNLRKIINSEYDLCEYYKDLSTEESLKHGLIAAAHQFSHSFLCQQFGIDPAKHLNEKK